MLESFTAEMFAGRIDERFRLRASADAAMDVELINVTVGPKNGGMEYEAIFT